MQINLLDSAWFIFVREITSEMVLVNEGILSAEWVLNVFVVVSYKMIKKLWSHVCMIWSWSHAGE